MNNLGNIAVRRINLEKKISLKLRSTVYPNGWVYSRHSAVALSMKGRE